MSLDFQLVSALAAEWIEIYGTGPYFYSIVRLRPRGGVD